MKRKITSSVNDDEFISTSIKSNKLNFLFDNSLIRDIMQYRGLTNYSAKKLPYSSKSLFRFFVNPNGLDTNDYWYLRINNLVQKNSNILHIYNLPNVSPSYFNNSFNLQRHQANSIALVDCKIENGEKFKDKANFIPDGFQFNACQKSAYEKIVGLSLMQNFSVVALVGPAGTGKTICLKQFVQKQHLFSYVTIQNNLLQDATIKLGLNAQQVFTLCRFIMNLFDLNFYEQCTFYNSITGNQIENFSRLFYELPVSLPFVKSLFTITCTLKDKDASSKDTTLFLCIDEFSMVSCNILQTLLKGLEHANKCLNAVDDVYKIIVILSGDCHQIQPIFTMKTAGLNRREMLKRESQKCTPLETRYRHEYISTNCRNILALVNEKFFFSQQLRNNNTSYMQFLNRILTCDNWQLEIINYFNRRCLQNQIYLHYPISSIKHLTKNVGNALQTVKWYRKNLRHFNTFNYFAWCNVDAHFINMSVFYSIYRTYFFNKSQKTAKIQPRLAPIYFYANSNFHNGYYDSVRLPFLPLILGMTYKILVNKANTLFRGQLLTLVDINDSNGGVLTCIDRFEKIYKIKPTFFTMNLFCQDASSHFVFQNMDKITINNSNYARMQKYGKLFGYPMQMACGDTVRASIGITVDSDLYINLNGCSLEEIYVILSRTTDEQKIKAVYIS